MTTDFEIMVAVCRKSYAAFQQLANRTDEALYEALGQVHALRSRMRTDTALRDKFDALLQARAGGKSSNETLFLVKHAFFPHTLQPGPGHKADITKASRYSKLINKALDENVEPADFVIFARQHGIQRTAAASRSSLRPSRGRSPPRRVKLRFNSSAATSSLPVMGARSFLSPILTPLELWLYSTAVSTRLASVLQVAEHQTQRLSLTIFVNHDRAVLTEVTGQTWYGEFPDGAIRQTRGTPAQPSPVAIQKASAEQLAPLSPPPLRGTSLSPMQTVNRGRRRATDGFVWPWRVSR